MPDNLGVEDLGRASRRAAIMSVCGFLVVIMSLAYSSYRLYSFDKARKRAQAELADIEKRKIELEIQIEEADKKLGVLNDALSRVATKDPELAKEAIDKAIESNPGSAKIVPRIYVQIGAESQRQKAKEIASKLQVKGYVVPGIEYVGKKAPVNTELRYFRKTEEEADEAEEIARLLRAAYVDIQVKNISIAGGTAIRPRHYELWFARPRTDEPYNALIRSIEMTPISPSVLKVKIQYAYDGSHGTNNIILIANALRDDETDVPGTSFAPAKVGVGEGTVSVDIEKTGNREPYSSTRIRVCLKVAARKTIACRTVRYAMEWK